MDREKLWQYVALVVLSVGAAIAVFFAFQNTAPRDVAPQPTRTSQTPTASPTAEEPPTALFIGDSYTHGTGASDKSARWSSIVADEFGWDEVNEARGGTGYFATSTVEGCGREYCPNYGEVLEELRSDFEPDIVVVAGGQNDFLDWGRDEDAVAGAIQDTYQAVQDQYPDARLISVGPSFLGSITDDMDAFDAEVQAAAESVDATYISLFDPPVLEEGMDSGDGAHVDDTGHQAIADRVIQGLG